MCLSVEVEMGSSCDKGIICMYLSSLCACVCVHIYIYSVCIFITLWKMLKCTLNTAYSNEVGAHVFCKMLGLLDQFE